MQCVKWVVSCCEKKFVKSNIKLKPWTDCSLPLFISPPPPVHFSILIRFPARCGRPLLLPLFSLHIDNYMHKKQTSTHTQPFEWQASSGWLTLLIPDVTHRRVFASACVLPVINYGPHAGDLLWLLITSQTKPTGGRFSCTNSDSISVWGLVYLRANVARMSVSLMRAERKKKKRSKNTNVHNVSKLNDGSLECVSPRSPLLLISNAACFVDLSSASGLWCGECLCCEPSAWSSRAPCSPCWSRRPSWKVGERLAGDEHLHILNDPTAPSLSLRDYVTCMSPGLLCSPIHSFAKSCYATTAQSCPVLFYSLLHIMQEELNTQGPASEPLSGRIQNKKRRIKCRNSEHKGSRNTIVV